jgi:hypothetical protein
VARNAEGAPVVTAVCSGPDTACGCDLHRPTVAWRAVYAVLGIIGLILLAAISVAALGIRALTEPKNRK